VPKETKRFINPLLRPSSNIDVETKPEPAQKQSEPEVASTKTMPDTATATSTEISVPPIREAVPLPQTGSKVSEPPDVQAVEPQTGEYATYPSTETSTSHVKMPIQRKSQISEPRAEIQAAPTEIGRGEDVAAHSSSLPGGYVNNTLPGSEPGFRTGHSPAFPSSAAVVPPPISPVPPLSPAVHSSEALPSLVSEETTFVSPLPQTSTYTYEEQKRQPLSAGYDEPGEQEYYTPPPVRRRRGAQSFEKTHERITVWVDKRLKQAFEELAYTEETSKTALLNEALADLLRKHSSR
jgi:hypothetical protein